MSKITVVGNSMVITSSLKLEDIETVGKYKPKALKLIDEDKNEYFGISAGANGNVSKWGIEFNGETRDDEKLATVTMFFDTNAECEDIKSMIADEFGEALLNLNKLEETIPDVVKELGKQKDAIMAGITIQ